MLKIFGPCDAHPDNMQNMVDKLLRACKPGDKIIFYPYSDVLKALKMDWVGCFLPKEIAEKLKRIDHEEVSIGVYEK